MGNQSAFSEIVQETLQLLILVQRVVESEQMYHRESEDLGGANSSYEGVKRGAV